MALNKDIQEEAQLSGQIEDIKNKIKAVFKARGETTKEKVNKVDKTELPELSAKKIAKMGLFTVPTT